MNNDIVPSLLEEIQKQFDEEIKANEKIKSILTRQKQGVVDYTDSLSFAKELGVSFATVNRWETGKAKPNLKTMKLIDEYCKKNGIDFDISEEI